MRHITPERLSDVAQLIEEVRKVWQFYRDRRPETYGDMVKLLP